MNEEKEPIRCIGFIMDGNRRWAKAHGVPTLEGHRAGYEALKGLVSEVQRAGIPHMAVYAFSTENWKRVEEEVGYLMKLLRYALGELPDVIRESGKRINLRVVGDRSALDADMQSAIAGAEARNYESPELTVWVALSYGGRAEIVSAANEAVARGERVTEDSLEKLLWTAEMPDPDIVVRTGGEKRLSNFLLWKASYSELFFTGTLWPDFGEAEFRSILDEYGKRQRRHGA